MKYFNLLRSSLLLIVLLASSLIVDAQQDSVKSLVKKLDTWRNTTLQEKIYAHIDRTLYLTGETMWMSLYYVDATFNRPLDISKVAYAEILDKNNKSLLQVKIALTTGGGYGSIFLPASLTSGDYLVRVYTNWMKNFSPDLFFQQAITIINPFTKLGLTVNKETPKFDVQFFPEGGNLVNGMRSKVGFRIANSTGKGIEFKGEVMSENNDTIVHFNPHKFGIGSFYFTPISGHHYVAIIHQGKNIISKVPLPDANNEGYVMSVTDSTSDKIKLSINAHSTSLDNAPFCYLLVHTRESAIQAKTIFLNGGKGIFILDKNSVGDGISHFTIFNAALLPVCERLYFKQPEKVVSEVQADQLSYGRRKKVILNFSTPATSRQGIPRASVAVYKLDSLQTDQRIDMASYLLLTSELKGNIESPAYYLNNRSEEAHQALDNLMLTHGWSRFRWDEIFQQKSMEFIPEYRGHIISGQVRGLQPKENRRVVAYLSNPDKNIRLYPSRSTVDGKVQFELRHFYGTRKLIVQMNTELDSIYDLEILSPFAKNFSTYKFPEFNFSTTLVTDITQRSLHMQVQNTFHDQKNDRFIVASTDTAAFYGKADERYYLDKYTRFPTMEEVMREYVKGIRVRKRRGKFHFVTLDNLNKTIFKEDPLVLLDGVPVFNINKIIAMDPLKVKKVEVMTRTYYLGPLAFDGIVSYTTYHGDMSDFEMDKRALILDYEGLQQYREFFSPQYRTDKQQNQKIPDARTLLYWNPEMIANKEGKLTCNFYTSDIPGKYKVVVESLSTDGKPSSASTVVEVK